jgi:hypothetical protein
MLELLHFDHFGEAVDALDERIFDGPAHAARERHELRWLEALVAEEDDLVLEEGAANFLEGDIFRKIDPVDLGAQRTGESSYLYCSTLMFASRMILA